MADRAAASLAILLLIGGCARYERKPLTAQSALAALTWPDDAALQAAASKVRHPRLPPVTIDFERGLTPDAAGVVAVVANPTLRALRDQRGLADAQLLQAGLLPNPQLDISFDPISGGNTLGTYNAYSIGLSWEVTALLVHEAKVASARAANQAAQLDVAWQEWQYAQAARKAAYDLLAQRRQLEVAREIEQRLSQNADVLRRAVEQHERTVVDLAAAEAASQKAHADALVAEHDAAQSQLTLNQAMGLPGGARVLLREPAAPPAAPTDQTLAALTRDIPEQRLDLLALRQGYESQEQTLRAAVLAQFPKILLGFHQASDTTNVHTTGVGATIDLPIFDQNQAVIATETATRQKLFDEYAARLFEARAAVAQASLDLRSLTAQIAAARLAIAAQQKLVDLYQQAAAQHNVDVVSLYTVMSDLGQRQIDLLKLQQLLIDNRLALELAVGRLIPGETQTSAAMATAKGPT